METQPPTAESPRDSSAYLLLIRDEKGSLGYSIVESRKEVLALLEKYGPEKLKDLKLFKAKEVEVRTKVSFTF